MKHTQTVRFEKEFVIEAKNAAEANGKGCCEVEERKVCDLCKGEGSVPFGTVYPPSK